jgi:hypothetical protein
MGSFPWLNGFGIQALESKAWCCKAHHNTDTRLPANKISILWNMQPYSLVVTEISERYNDSTFRVKMVTVQFSKTSVGTTKLHGVTSQNTIIFIATAARTSYVTCTIKKYLKNIRYIKKLFILALFKEICVLPRGILFYA